MANLNFMRKPNEFVTITNYLSQVSYNFVVIKVVFRKVKKYYKNK